MKAAAAIASLGLLALTASAIEVRGPAFILNAEEMAMCNAEGGCAVMTRRAMDDLIEMRARELAGACRNTL